MTPKAQPTGPPNPSIGLHPTRRQCPSCGLPVHTWRHPQCSTRAAPAPGELDQLAAVETEEADRTRLAKLRDERRRIAHEAYLRQISGDGPGI